MAKRSDRASYMISAVARKYNIHPQTLRLYEREGLLTVRDSRVRLTPEGATVADAIAVHLAD